MLEIITVFSARLYGSRSRKNQKLVDGGEASGSGGIFMIVAPKIALAPNSVQETYFRKAAGVARFAYNWALDQWQQQDEAWKAAPTVPKPSDAALRRPLNAMKRDQFPWMLEVTRNAPQMAIIHLGHAFKNFFAGIAEYPTFKKKGRHDSFALTNDPFTIKGQKVHIPKLGWVRLHEPWRFVGKVLGGTISRTADRWFLSVTVEILILPLLAAKTKRWSEWTWACRRWLPSPPARKLRD